ncbi:hypothetical protein [Methylobacterium oryzae]|uniref:hypothetical protein n=1 Tax=Methylobacterium oryzae TaxID=334852 RepID=UPI001F484629|nr:hypothetical protein [Methylobacterium oryzae]UIN34043.1 hypothetical protein LXM90_23640 [Methylobacterium oryzae]
MLFDFKVLSIGHLEAGVSGKAPHYAVKFAERYGSPADNYLNAGAALYRLDELLEDAKNLKDNFDKWVPEDNRWAPWVGSEIISYYGVAFVTCLEWHARSRLVDLLTFKPSAAKTDDLRVIKEKVVIEMFAANVTLPAIVGAVTSVSNLDDYLNIFARIFEALGQQIDAWAALKAERPGTGKPWVETVEFDDLYNLYSSRHDLVHEIGITRIGHINVRDRLSPNEALRIGDIVQRSMLAIESALTRVAPADFPNLLDIQGQPVSTLSHIEEEIGRLEKSVGTMTTAFTDEPVEADPNWGPAKTAAADYLAQERKFIDGASMLHNRYVEMREPLRIALAKSRLDYLRSVIDMVGEVWDVSSPPSGNP